VPSQANFVWVAAGERTEELEALLRDGGVITRAFPGEGVRISSGSGDDIDRVAAALVREAVTA
jgi:histidinol-phosphate aminotransferase